MDAPEYFTLDGDVANGVNPYRPSLTSFGGATKIDDQTYPPDPETMLTAAQENQKENALAGLSRIAPLARLYVKFSGGTPSLYAVLAFGSELQISDFTVTDSGTGTTSITCSATKIPGPAFPSGLTLLSSSDVRGSAVVNGGGDGIIVYTRNSAGTLADIDFVVDWV